MPQNNMRRILSSPYSPNAKALRANPDYDSRSYPAAPLPDTAEAERGLLNSYLTLDQLNPAPADLRKDFDSPSGGFGPVFKPNPVGLRDGGDMHMADGGGFRIPGGGGGLPLRPLAPGPQQSPLTPGQPQTPIPSWMRASMRNGGELCMARGGPQQTMPSGHGGTVPGTGEGDKIAAKYEPGEFVVSNDMLEAEPELREHLRGLREEVLAAKGMTPEEADAKAVKGGTLRAQSGGPIDKWNWFANNLPEEAIASSAKTAPLPGQYAIETPQVGRAMALDTPEKFATYQVKQGLMSAEEAAAQGAERQLRPNKFAIETPQGGPARSVDGPYKKGEFAQKMSPTGAYSKAAGQPSRMPDGARGMFDSWADGPAAKEQIRGDAATPAKQSMRSVAGSGQSYQSPAMPANAGPQRAPKGYRAGQAIGEVIRAVREGDGAVRNALNSPMGQVAGKAGGIALAGADGQLDVGEVLTDPSYENNTDRAVGTFKQQVRSGLRTGAGVLGGVLGGTVGMAGGTAVAPGVGTAAGMVLGGAGGFAAGQKAFDMADEGFSDLTGMQHGSELERITAARRDSAPYGADGRNDHSLRNVTNGAPIEIASNDGRSDRRLSGINAPYTYTGERGDEFSNESVQARNPGGAIRKELRDNGTMSYSGGNVTGDASFTDKNGKALPGRNGQVSVIGNAQDAARIKSTGDRMEAERKAEEAIGYARQDRQALKIQMESGKISPALYMAQLNAMDLAQSHKDTNATSRANNTATNATLRENNEATVNASLTTSQNTARTARATAQAEQDNKNKAFMLDVTKVGLEQAKVMFQQREETDKNLTTKLGAMFTTKDGDGKTVPDINAVAAGKVAVNAHLDKLITAARNRGDHQTAEMLKREGPTGLGDDGLHKLLLQLQVRDRSAAAHGKWNPWSGNHRVSDNPSDYGIKGIKRGIFQDQYVLNNDGTVPVNDLDKTNGAPNDSFAPITARKLREY